jgi:hypothetical protein
MHENESDASAAVLVDHATSPNFQVRWNWTEGDVVMWDERCTQHFAVADFFPQRTRDRPRQRHSLTLGSPIRASGTPSSNTRRRPIRPFASAEGPVASRIRSAQIEGGRDRFLSPRRRGRGRPH